ncbi:hypothetical protein ACFULT_22065 [Rhodococcus sp. NPDC057297]|uniref:hypothetical protein n=1 Tax=Rhodococcus sp. NPDC057297 TaxID=3346090 RepID=UPI0036322577
MAPNNDRVVLSNGIDWVSVFLDGRVKVASRFHLWDIVDSGRHTALGEYITLGAGRELDVEPRRGAAKVPDFATSLDPRLDRTIAATVVADNGTFVEFVHDGGIRVGNDGRDVAETFNTGRESLDGGASGRGGAVMVTFVGTYRPAGLRSSDYSIQIPPRERPASNRLYPGEYEIYEGKIGPPRPESPSWFL